MKKKYKKYIKYGKASNGDLAEVHRVTLEVAQRTKIKKFSVAIHMDVPMHKTFWSLSLLVTKIVIMDLEKYKITACQNMNP